MAQTVHDDTPILKYAIDIVAAHVGHNAIPASEVPEFIQRVYETLRDIDGPVSGRRPADAGLSPAVPVEVSVQPDHIVCLEDGKKLRMLKRYLMAQYGMTPHEYRRKWNLPADYPMVAPEVSEQRRSSALRNGLRARGAAPVKRGAPRRGSPRR